MRLASFLLCYLIAGSSAEVSEPIESGGTWHLVVEVYEETTNERLAWLESTSGSYYESEHCLADAERLAMPAFSGVRFVATCRLKLPVGVRT